jgi:hypothetical protein
MERRVSEPLTEAVARQLKILHRGTDLAQHEIAGLAAS